MKKTPRQILDQFIADMEASQGFPISKYYRGHLEDVLAWNAMDCEHNDKITNAAFRQFEAAIRSPIELAGAA